MIRFDDEASTPTDPAPPIASPDASVDASAAAPATAAPHRAQPSAVTEPTAARRRTTVTFYVTPALRNRARSVYRATSFAERDSSWSEMLTKALIAEIERRELAHNAGKTFDVTDEPLTPGRPIGF